MKRDVAEAALVALVRSVAPHSDEGQRVFAGAKEALHALPKGIDPELVKKAYARMAAVDPQALWPLIGRARPEHAQGVLDAVVGQESLAARFVVAAASGGTQTRTLDVAGASRLIQAGCLLARLHDAPAPRSKAAVDKVRPLMTEPLLVQAWCRALQVRLPALPPGEVALAVWGLALLCTDGCDSARRVLGAVLKDAARGAVPGLNSGALRRLIGLFVAEHPPLAQLLLSS
jgi:hypothetical protein